ncbi:MAG: CarD family transcriptional regulator [Clostridia bacterium]|nr:CarD family transcriptional regulator [Clostridia bacterium]MDH7573330.1 CarD family transcriptional regulator [Clostridia bacterium]
MFKVGDRVVYPMHGAGIIEAIEEKEILGQKRQYYVMHLPMGDIKLMIPTDNVEETGLREVISQEEVPKVLRILRERKVSMCSNWNRRYRANLEKIKSGNIYEVAEVVRNLVLRERERGLSSGERRMLDSARQILISELVLAQGKAEEEVANLLDGLLA